MKMKKKISEKGTLLIDFNVKKVQVHCEYLRFRLHLSLSVNGQMAILQLFVTELPFVRSGKCVLNGNTD